MSKLSFLLAHKLYCVSVWNIYWLHFEGLTCCRLIRSLQTAAKLWLLYKVEFEGLLFSSKIVFALSIVFLKMHPNHKRAVDFFFKLLLVKGSKDNNLKKKNYHFYIHRSNPRRNPKVQNKSLYFPEKIWWWNNYI